MWEKHLKKVFMYICTVLNSLDDSMTYILTILMYSKINIHIRCFSVFIWSAKIPNHSCKTFFNAIIKFYRNRNSLFAIVYKNIGYRLFANKKKCFLTKNPIPTLQQPWLCLLFHRYLLFLAHAEILDFFDLTFYWNTGRLSWTRLTSISTLRI